MKFYHYTSAFHWQIIKNSEGLSRGDVPTSPTGGYQAVWLTSRESDSNNWSKGSAVNKTEVLLEVSIDADDPMLHSWQKVITDNKIADWWVKALNKDQDSDNWFVYHDTIPLSSIKVIREL